LWSRASTFSGKASPLAVMLHLKTFTAAFGFALEIIFLSAVGVILYRGFCLLMQILEKASAFCAE
jgi:hypothetical protein